MASSSSSLMSRSNSTPVPSRQELQWNAQRELSRTLEGVQRLEGLTPKHSTMLIASRSIPSAYSFHQTPSTASLASTSTPPATDFSRPNLSSGSMPMTRIPSNELIAVRPTASTTQTSPAAAVLLSRSQSSTSSGIGARPTGLAIFTQMQPNLHRTHSDSEATPTRSERSTVHEREPSSPTRKRWFRRIVPEKLVHYNPSRDPKLFAL